jgi:hypothetical protein
MANQIALRVPKTIVREGSGFTVTGNFRTRETGAADTPSSVRYRLDCLTTGREILAWTTVTAAAQVSIAVTGAQNAIIDDCNDYEIKQLILESDNGSSDQYRERITWKVENMFGVE